MPAILFSAVVQGVEGALIRVEVDVSSGLPAVNIVGLPDVAVQEAKERIRSAIRQSGWFFPLRRITVNLSPADVKKVGTHLDLPMAIGVLIASEQISSEVAKEKLFFGELTLDGRVQRVRGATILGAAAQAHDLMCVVPPENVPDIQCTRGLRFQPLSSLADIVISRPTETARGMGSPDPFPALSWWPSICGQAHAKRAVTIACAGRHNILLVGPPGSGKTMLAEGAAEMLPNLIESEAFAVQKIHSLMPTPRPRDFWRPPFRHPHHSASLAALVGGGSRLVPGEITFAHHGLLFLDELPEFPRQHLEALRQPIEDGRVTISRVAGTVEYPARAMIIAAMNPCPCGFAGDGHEPCVCSPQQRQKYQHRLSGPLLDRFDMIVTVPRLPIRERQEQVTVSDPRPSIVRARELQLARGRGNASLRGQALEQAVHLDMSGQQFLRQAAERVHLSARGYDRILRVARTIADLAEQATVTVDHLAEALMFRGQR